MPTSNRRFHPVVAHLFLLVIAALALPSVPQAGTPTGRWNLLVVRVDFEDAPGVQFTTTQFRDEWLAALESWYDDMSNDTFDLEPFYVETVITLGPRRIYHGCTEPVLMPGEACTSAVDPTVQQLVADDHIDVLADEGLVPEGSTDPADVFDGIMIVFGNPLDYPLMIFRGPGACGAAGYAGVWAANHVRAASGSAYPGGIYQRMIVREDSDRSCDGVFDPLDLFDSDHEVGHGVSFDFGNSSNHPAGYKNKFEVMDSCSVCYTGAYTRMTDAARGGDFEDYFPGWLPDANVATFDPPTGGGLVVLSPIEWDPDIATSPQALRVGTADGTIHIAECRRQISWDAAEPLLDVGVQILTATPGGSPATVPRMPPGGNPFEWGNPANDDLWKDGQIFFDVPNDVVLLIGPDSGPGCSVTVEYGALSMAAVPDLGLIPWRTPPLNTWETIDIWVDSSCNGYEEFGGELRRGRDGLGNVIGNGDDMCANRENRVYAKIRNFGTQDAINVTGTIQRTDPLGVGIRGASGWIDIGTFGPVPVIPRNSDVTVFVEWNPVVTPPAPDRERFPFHSCLRVMVDAVTGERILTNQDGNGEQENLSHVEVRREAASASYFFASDELVLANADNEPGDFFITVMSELPDGWTLSVAGGLRAFSLPAGGSVTLPVLLRAPDGAPLGERHEVKVFGFKRETFVNPDTGQIRNESRLVSGAVLAAETVLNTTMSMSATAFPFNSCAPVHISASGCLSDAAAGATISLEADAPDGSRQTELVVTDGAGCFAKDIPVSMIGDWQVQAFWHGDTTRGSASSTRVVVKAYDPADIDCDDVQDVNDNCQGIANPNQFDPDQDGFGDLCDCNSLDGGAWILPPEVTGVRFFPDRQTLQWDDLGPVAGWSTLYDVTTGSLEDLPASGEPSEICLGQQIQGTSATDTRFPALNKGYWFFLQASNSCGYGTPGSGAAGQRGTAACGVCPHDICTEGLPLDPSCGSCAAQICQQDPFCCDSAWDVLCVGEVQTICSSSECQGN